MGTLDGQVALVTGAGRGIGAGIASALARAGARVVVNYRSSRREAEGVVDRLAEEGCEAMAVEADVTDEQAVARMMDRTLERYSRLDVLVNNAGLALDAPFLEMTRNMWDDVLRANLTGTFVCSQAAARIMLRQGRGKIINIGASTGIRGRRNGANYCAAKGGVLALTKAMAHDLAPAVTVNALCPGFVPTKDVVDRFGLDDPAAVRRMLDQIPMGRLANFDDVGAAAVFLAGPGSDYITGQLLFVNGGMFMY
ncbi:MAG: 3-oxoacyl-ACP reductase FabG [Firmicutes bacterium]|nr:3-oxoacyl-ACP reductase FabG [Bacillota bacterium]